MVLKAPRMVFKRWSTTNKCEDKKIIFISLRLWNMSGKDLKEIRRQTGWKTVIRAIKAGWVRSLKQFIVIVRKTMQLRLKSTQFYISQETRWNLHSTLEIEKDRYTILDAIYTWHRRMQWIWYNLNSMLDCRRIFFQIRLESLCN